MLYAHSAELKKNQLFMSFGNVHQLQMCGVRGVKNSINGLLREMIFTYSWEVVFQVWSGGNPTTCRNCKTHMAQKKWRCVWKDISTPNFASPTCDRICDKIYEGDRNEEYRMANHCCDKRNEVESTGTWMVESKLWCIHCEEPRPDGIWSGGAGREMRDHSSTMQIYCGCSWSNGS